MNDGEVESSGLALFPKPNSSSDFQGSTSVDTFLDEYLKNTCTCTHTHTCNPPGPDAAHAHNCYHTHTLVLPSEDDNITKNKEHSTPRPRRRRPSGNREAVRKYREKKKAHTAYLEEEVKKLQLLNQQLVRKIQGQTFLEAEFSRLRSLLMDLRGKIDSEFAASPFQKPCNTASTIFKEGNSDLQSTVGSSGFHCRTDFPVATSLQTIIASGKPLVLSGGNCQPPVVDCQANTTELG